MFIYRHKNEHNTIANPWILNITLFWLNHCRYSSGKQFVELPKVLWSDGIQDLSRDFLYLFLCYVYDYSSKEIKQIIKKLVTQMKPFKFASSPRNLHLSSSMGLELIWKKWYVITWRECRNGKSKIETFYSNLNKF